MIWGNLPAPKTINTTTSTSRRWLKLKPTTSPF
jgi:hypothetical protein